jgi:hypothetical protein
MDCTTHTDILLSRLNEILLDCSNESQPPKKGPSKNRKGKWQQNLKLYIAASKHAFWEWKEAGRNIDLTCASYRKMKDAKVLLRHVQRTNAAKERTALYTEIMDSHSGDPRTFYKLVSQQRKSPYSSGSIDFPNNITGENDTEKWASFFLDLATPKDLPEFDQEHKTSMVLRRLLISTLPSDHQLPDITEEQVRKYVLSLSNNKAADAAGITSEHLKYAAECLIPILTALINRVLSTGKLPGDFKMGIATPIPKKSTVQRDPDKYRRITITSLIGKLVEKHMVHLAEDTLSKAQSRLQFGFTKNVPCNTASILLTEVINHYKDTGAPLFLTFMDASKAFDVVDHDCALNHLYNQGIRGDLWTLFNNLYTNITSTIKWQGKLSQPFMESQGIRQGAISSTNIFKARANPTLSRLEEHPASARIGSISLGPIMVADDLVLSSPSASGVQALVSEAELDAARERFSFSKTKTKVVTTSIKSKQPPEASILLNGTKLEQSSAETHLGIVRSSDGRNTLTIQNRVQTARRTGYSLMGAGYHGLNGVGPEVGRHLWLTYVQPRLLYGLESLILSRKELDDLENYLRINLRAIQHLPKSTATPALYLLSGVPPIEAQLDITTLVYFTKALRRENSVEKAVIERQLCMKDPSSCSWVWHVQGLLKKYCLPSAFTLLEQQPTHAQWKRSVKAAVLNRWEHALKEDATRMTTLSNVNLEKCTLSAVHPVWKIGAASSLTVVKATTKAKLLLQRYPLYNSKTSGVNYGKPCPLCNSCLETLEHFLMSCPALDSVRRQPMQKITSILAEARLPIPTEEAHMVRLLLDPSWICPDGAPDALNGLLEATTRDLCFALHHRRSILLGYPSRYTQGANRSSSRGLLKSTV